MSGVHAVLLTGQTAPLVPVTAALLAHLRGVQGAVGAELFFLALLISGAYALARIWVGPTASGIAAMAAGGNQAVLGWALMLNFAVAAAAATVWTFACYLHSDRLADKKWAVATGVAGGLLLLSRSLAPVYAAPLVVVIAIDVLWHHRARKARLPWSGLTLSTATALVIAGPWWLLSGRTALRYLRNAGYQGSSGFAGAGGVHLSLSALSDRARWTLDDLGVIQSAALILALAAAIAVLVSKRRRARGVLTIGAWAAATFVVLATSRNVGTGFGVPVVVMVVILVAVVVPQHRVPAALAAAILAFGVAAVAGGHTSEWWLGPPYRTEAIESTHLTHAPSFDFLEQSVLATIGRGPSLLARDDDAVNANGLSWFAIRQNTPGFSLIVPPFGPGALDAVRADLLQARFLITGTTPAPYHLSLSQDAVKRIAASDGFTAIRIWHISADSTVEVWRRA